jgi:hypothetical protein
MLNIHNKYRRHNFFILHFWVGSFCGFLDDGGSKPAFPRGVIAGTDIIGLIEDMEQSNTR